MRTKKLSGANVRNALCCLAGVSVFGLGGAWAQTTQLAALNAAKGGYHFSVQVLDGARADRQWVRDSVSEFQFGKTRTAEQNGVQLSFTPLAHSAEIVLFKYEIKRGSGKTGPLIAKGVWEVNITEPNQMLLSAPDSQLVELRWAPLRWAPFTTK